MSNSAYNLFVITLGFLLLGLPIILISYSTRPPTVDQFYSSIVISDIPNDPRSGVVLNETAKIAGNSSYWKSLGSIPQLSYLNNISKMIVDETNFMKHVNISDYGGFKKNIHIFNLTMAISLYNNSVSSFYKTYYSLFGSKGNSTFMFVKVAEEPDAYTIYSDSTYPTVNSTFHQIEERGITIKYLITVEFNGILAHKDGNYKLQFDRIILVDTNEFPVFFVSNEVAWTLMT